jgi:hypothetical protein
MLNYEPYTKDTLYSNARQVKNISIETTLDLVIQKEIHYVPWTIMMEKSSSFNYY